jgi:hypothetical protein
MRHLILIPLLFGIIACESNQISTPETSVDEVLNDWHKAAYAADAERYFGHFKDSTSIFMGTDASERWNVNEFREYAVGPFSDGEGWNFSPFNRFISYSEDGKYAWFDEELNTPNLGLCRGSGVLENVEGEWKIVHYNLALAIPNEVVYDVRDMISELNKEEN